MSYTINSDDLARTIDIVSRILAESTVAISPEAIDRLSDTFSHLQLPDYSKISQSILSSIELLDNLSKPLQSFSIHDSAVNLYDRYFESMNKIVLNPVDPSVLKNLHITVQTPDYDPDDVLRPAYEVIRQNKDLLTDKQVDAVNEISPEILSSDETAKPKSNNSTWDKALLLIPILLALIQIYISCLPDKQLDMLIQQNEVEISQRSEENIRLKQLVDAQERLLQYIEQSNQLSQSPDDLPMEVDNPVTEDDDGIDDSCDSPELPEADSSPDENRDSDHK